MHVMPTTPHLPFRCILRCTCHAGPYHPSPAIAAVATALAKVQLSLTADVTSAMAAADTASGDSTPQVLAVTSDTDMADACCMRRVQGFMGRGLANTAEPTILLSRLTQHWLPCDRDSERNATGNRAFRCFRDRYISAGSAGSSEQHTGRSVWLLDCEHDGWLTLGT
jgi:hypothetical protein